MNLAKRIAAGEKIPKGFGIAMLIPWRDEAICLPIPLNLICRRIVAIWFWLKNPPFSWWEQNMADMIKSNDQHLFVRIKELERQNLALEAELNFRKRHD